MIKIGQSIAINEESLNLLKASESYHPRFIHWLTRVHEDSLPDFKNLKDSADRIKPERVKEFEDKRGLLIESIAQMGLTEEESDAKYKEAFKPLKDEYDADLKEFDALIEEFETDILEEESNKNFPKIALKFVPKNIEFKQLRAVYPFITIEGKNFAETEIPFQQILMFANYPLTDRHSLDVKLSIIDLLNKVNPDIRTYLKNKKAYSTHKDFADFTTEIDQVLVNKEMSDDDKEAKIKEIKERYTEINAISEWLIKEEASVKNVKVMTLSIDDLPETMKALEFRLLEVLLRDK